MVKFTTCFAVVSKHRHKEKEMTAEKDSLIHAVTQSDMDKQINNKIQREMLCI